MKSLSNAVVYNLTRTHLIDYLLAWKYQKALSEENNYNYNKYCNASTITSINEQDNNLEDSILLLQHPSVYTLGRGASPNNLRFKPSPSSDTVYRVERGGEVTWHGPGQLVAYPIINLKKHKKDLHWYTNRLEEAVINTLRHYGIEGKRSSVNTGVWVGTDKICAIGVTASRWITMHGLALNVNNNAKYFDQIVPCGIDIPGYGVCSMEQHKGEHKAGAEHSVDQVSSVLLQAIAHEFNLNIINHPSQGLLSKQNHNIEDSITSSRVPSSGIAEDELGLLQLEHLNALVDRHLTAIEKSTVVSRFLA